MKGIEYIKQTNTELLKEIGDYQIDYTLSGEIKKNLDTKYIGNSIYGFKEVESTNNIAKFLAEYKSPEGTIVISEIQTKGKGRNGRKWESPIGGIWLSIILKPDIEPLKAPLITLATGVAVIKTLKELNIYARIKWPNDILINNKKVCGILTEANTKFNRVNYIIVGVGIDAKLDINTLSKDLREITTSLNRETQKEIKELKIITNFLKEFEEIYNLYKAKKFDEILNDWRHMSQTIGSYVEIKDSGKTLKGIAVGINNQGALILELKNGNFKKIIYGECTP